MCPIVGSLCVGIAVGIAVGVGLVGYVTVRDCVAGVNWRVCPIVVVVVVVAYWWGRKYFGALFENYETLF